MQDLLQNFWFQVALKVAMTGGIFLFVLIVCGLLIAGLQRLFRVTVQRTHSLSINNQGNAPSVYHLTVDSPEPKLKFQFFQNDIPLTEIEVNVEPSGATVQKPFNTLQTEMVAAPVAAPAATQGKTLAAQNTAQPKTAIQGAAVVKDPGKAAEKVVAKTGALASLMGTVGGLLPGSLGKSIKEQSGMVREVQSKTKDAAQKPQEMQRKVEQMQKDSGKLGVKTDTVASQPGVQTAVASGSNRTAPQNQHAATTQAGAVGQVQPVTFSPVQPAVLRTMKCFRTSEAGPDETLQMTLQISSNSRVVPEGSFLYTVKSQQVPLDKFDKPIPPLTKQGIVHFDRIGKWHYWLPNLISVLLVLTGLLSIGYTIYRIWL